MEETTDSGTNWGALASILAGLVGGMASGQSLTGEPAKQVSNTGPLTPEGQRIMAEYTRALDATPLMRTDRMGGVSVTRPNRSRTNILQQMAALEAIRRGNLSPQAASTGLLGKLAPLLASLGGKQDIWGGIKAPQTVNTYPAWGGEDFSGGGSVFDKSGSDWTGGDF